MTSTWKTKIDRIKKGGNCISLQSNTLCSQIFKKVQKIWYFSCVWFSGYKNIDALFFLFLEHCAQPHTEEIENAFLVHEKNIKLSPACYIQFKRYISFRNLNL